MPPSRAALRRRARHPLVVAGNAIFTILLILGVCRRLATYPSSRQAQTSRCPRPAGGRRQGGQHSAWRFGLREIADLLAREKVIDQPWVFIGGVLVMKAR